MINFFKSIAFYFSKKIHLTKLKVLLCIPILIASLTSFILTIDLEEGKVHFSDMVKNQNEFYALLLFLILLFIIDLIYEFVTNKSADKRRKDVIEVLKDQTISEDLKKTYLGNQN